MVDNIPVHRGWNGRMEKNRNLAQNSMQRAQQKHIKSIDDDSIVICH